MHRILRLYFTHGSLIRSQLVLTKSSKGHLCYLFIKKTLSVHVSTSLGKPQNKDEHNVFGENLADSVVAEYISRRLAKKS